MRTTMRRFNLPEFALLLAVLAIPVISAPCRGAESGRHSRTKFTALPISGSGSKCSRMLYRYGIPFMERPWHLPASGSLQEKVGVPAKEIFLLGMTETERPQAWSDAASYANRFFIGDHLGQIRLHYANGVTEDYPLVLGESVWWGLPFYQTREPFPTGSALRSALEKALHLYPAAPVSDGNYVAVIMPGKAPLASIEFLSSPEKRGSVAIAGITVETAEDVSIVGGTVIPAGPPDPQFEEFAEQGALRAAGVDEERSRQRLELLKEAFYTSDADFKLPIATQIPFGYSGPQVTFKGTPYASALQNAFYANVADMLAKIDPTGEYHTSTKYALSWAGIPRSAGGEFGTYRADVGIYYGDSWSRDLGRSLQELTDLGYTKTALQTADYVFRMARLWEANSALKYHGEALPPHWSRVINRPDFSLPFENDGHGLISLFLYQLWRRLPNRDAWLREHWPDVKAAGDWIPWQFVHSDVSGATDGVLHTTGESAGGNGYSVYPDAVCMTALEGLARMADSIGETQSAELWRDTAAKMRSAIPKRYLVDDPKYGRAWTLVDAGWPNKSTVLGPLIFTADYRGYAPDDIYAPWRSADAAAYQRLIDTYKPFGFYGWAMGYGQGFVTQSALLLDRMKDATEMLNWTALEVNDPQIHSYVVPEGVQVDPTGRFLYRTGDQGNGVQEAEIIKIFRILIGVDDLDSRHIKILPRLPYGWSEIAVNNYPVLVQRAGRTESTHLRYRLELANGHLNFAISSDLDLGAVTVRLGPFENKPSASEVRLNGRLPKKAMIQHSGDSWWVQCTAHIGHGPASTHS